MALADALAELGQAGRMVDAAALAALPEPPPPRWGHADYLRAALAQLGDGKVPRSLLDQVLGEGCRLHAGWRKGAGLQPEDTQTLIDGSACKPRQLLYFGDGPVLAVFTPQVDRVGLHKGRRPVAHAIEYLRRRGMPLGLVTNGREWRLIFADVDNVAWLQWSADRWLDGDQLTPAYLLLRQLLGRDALLPAAAGQPSALLSAIRQTRRGKAELTRELGENVRRAVELVLRGRAEALGRDWNVANSKAVYGAACRLVMRLVVVLFAEARELLPIDNPVYHHSYGLRGLQEALDRMGPERRRQRQSAWLRLLALFRLLHQGSRHPALLVPAYGGELFQAGDPTGDPLQRALATLESAADAPNDDVVGRILWLLTRTHDRGAAVPVDFSELTSEYIGILYEGLLDYELHRVGEAPVVFLNLGDQPALPIDRLEALDDARLKALVEKAKVKGGKAEEEAGDSDEVESEEEDEAEPEIAKVPVVQPGADADDRLGQALDRARRWAERAVEVGGLVRKPRGRAGRDDPAWQAERDAKTQGLIADVKLPADLYLVRWGGTRKGAGTFYTRPQLTLPTVRRTLEPLLCDEQGGMRPPEVLLGLKVCDPAMGSGSFLVAALRVLTAAVREALHVHGRLQPVGERWLIDCAQLPEGDREQPEDRIDAIVRRAVVEHCLYGVDLDPLAVELGRVALWIETLDRRLPFTFLDHKLRCGNSLVGAWLDQFRDYPLLAWARQSPDEKWAGVHHAADVWSKQLKATKQGVVAEQAAILTGQRQLAFAALSDERVQQALQRVRALYALLRAVPATQPDVRAEIWRTQVVVDADWQRVKAACDAWCALWFWPLDRLDVAPRPAAWPEVGAAAAEVVREVAGRLRFFHWELEFADVFTAAGSGFDAVVGNPPWETLQPQSKEFFADLDPLYRGLGKQEALARQKELFAAELRVESDWLAYIGTFKDIANFVASAGAPFGDRQDNRGRAELPLARGDAAPGLHRRWKERRLARPGFSDPVHPYCVQGDGKAYSYKLFVEVTHAILRRGGQFGLVTPSGLYTDKGAIDLRKLLLYNCRWRWLYGFENRDKVFDIDSRFKFAVTLAEKGGKTESLRAAFMRHDLDDWQAGVGALDYPAERIAAFSPKSLSVLEIRSERDLAVLTRIYANSVLLGDDGPDGWGIRYAQGDFNMTTDSRLFIARDKAEAAGFAADAYGRWVDAAGEVLLPLYQGAMIWQFDPLFGRDIAVRPIRPDHAKLLMRNADARVAIERTGTIRVAFRDVQNHTNQRTFIGALIPGCPAGNTVPILWRDGATATSLASILAALCSFPCDMALRTKMSQNHVNWFYAEELPIPVAAEVEAGLHRCVLQLSAVGWMYATLWISARNQQVANLVSWALTPPARLRLRCILDATVAALYHLDRADFHWILRDCDHPIAAVTNKAFARTLDPKGFWRVDKHQPPELRHTVLSLVAFDDLLSHIAAHAPDRDAGIHAFLHQNAGEGWQLPETLCLADHGLGHDDRAKHPQPVASALGPLYLPWQLTQTPEESWAECERHARAILGEAEFERRFGAGAAQATATESGQPIAAATAVDGGKEAVQLSLFGGAAAPGGRGGRR